MVWSNLSFCVRALWTPVNSYGPLVILVQGPKALEIILLVRALVDLQMYICHVHVHVTAGCEWRLLALLFCLGEAGVCW